MRFRVVAFDLDGTLYPNNSFYIQLVPFLLRELNYLRVFGKARDRLRQEDATGLCNRTESFYKTQAQYMSEILKADPVLLEEKTEKLIYRGWEPLFKKVKLFPHVTETLAFLREKGIKLALLSDFPPETKLENLGLAGFWDAVLCSEAIGRLKPDPASFFELIRVMDCPPDEILYVGNSFSYDVLGAQKTGMKAAWIRPKTAYFFPNKKKERKADFVFFDYRQLIKFVLT